jgi:hypothetical protein
MDRITQRDLAVALRRYDKAARNLGLIPNGMHLYLQHGSKTNGIAYRVNLVWDQDRQAQEDSGHHRPPMGDDYLGMTAREAYNALYGRAVTAEDIRYQMPPLALELIQEAIRVGDINSTV